MNGISAALRNFSFSQTVRLSILTLQNTTAVRSMPVEVEGAPDSLLFSDSTLNPQTDYVSITFGVALTKSNSFRARIAGKKGALKLKQFVDYLTVKHPKKLAP
jgi:hypothetical protein